MSVALFPGQGVQTAGMDRGLPERHAEVFDIASDVLDVDVRALCKNGRSGSASLDDTRWAQPAVLVCSVASFRESERHHRFDVVAGHSVGEYAALVASRALTFDDALRLVSTRAAVTAEVAHATNGAMAALLRVDIGMVTRLCSDAGVELAADNANGQYVVSGPSDRIDAAIAALEGSPAVAKRLEVDGAFHSRLMAPARAALADAIADVELVPPEMAFWSSTTATRLHDPEAIRRALLEQLTNCVRWRETVLGIAACGHTVFTDIGPGRVVGTLARRILPDASVRAATDLLDPVAAS